MRNIIMITLIVLGLISCVSAEWTAPEGVDEINTEFTDKYPFLSFDGLSLYFCRLDTDTFYYTRIFRATRSQPNGLFSSVEEVSELNYSGGHVTSPWVSADNLRMYYVRTEPGSYWRAKFSERSGVNEPWPAGVNITELNALGHIARPRLTEDELVIVVISQDIAGGEGGYDIWMATRPDTSSAFGDVRNVSELNTSFDDIDGFLSGDGLTIWFSSNRNGKNQIFKAARTSRTEPFGGAHHLEVFDTALRSSSPAVSSDGTEFYLTVRDPVNEDLDVCVSYQEATTAIDIKPGSCPNPLSLAGKGKLPVAIPGSADFDVHSINVMTVRLEGVAPIRCSYEDVTSPAPVPEQCECSSEGPDGYMDLVLKFKTQEIVEKLIAGNGELVKGQTLELVLTAALSDETRISGSDCVVLVGNVSKHILAKQSDINGDGIVDYLDFAELAAYWLEPCMPGESILIMP